MSDKAEDFKATMKTLDTKWGNTETPEATRVAQDMVNSPDHYMSNGIEAIEVIEAKLGGKDSEYYRGFLMGNTLKYLMRCLYKGKYEEDIRKASWYIQRLEGLFDDEKSQTQDPEKSNPQ